MVTVMVIHDKSVRESLLSNRGVPWTAHGAKNRLIFGEGCANRTQSLLRFFLFLKSAHGELMLKFLIHKFLEDPIK